MGTKEVMAMAPAVILLLDLTLVAPAPREAWRRRWRIHVALWLSLGVMVFLEMRMFAGSLRLEQNQVAPVSAVAYLLTQGGVLLHYLRLVVVPWPLCLDYGWPFAGAGREAWPAFTVMAALVAVTALGTARRHPVAVASACAILILAPSSSLVPVLDAAFEHRMYLPLAGVLAAVVGGAYALLRTRVRPGVLRLVAVLLVVAAAAMTWMRNRDYRGELAMWTRVVAVRPGNLRARNDYAAALSQAGHLAAAEQEYNRVLAAIPAGRRRAFENGGVSPGSFPTRSFRYHFFRAHANYGTLLMDRRSDPAGAVRHFILALRVAARHPEVEPKLREALRRLGTAEDELDRNIAGLVLGRLDWPEPEEP